MLSGSQVTEPRIGFLGGKICSLPSTPLRLQSLGNPTCPPHAVHFTCDGGSLLCGCEINRVVFLQQRFYLKIEEEKNIWILKQISTVAHVTPCAHGGPFHFSAWFYGKNICPSILGTKLGAVAGVLAKGMWAEMKSVAP